MHRRCRRTTLTLTGPLTLTSRSSLVSGSLAAVRPEPLARHAVPCCADFPFRCMGVAITLNGFASFAADVIHIGHPQTIWKPIDVVLATGNTIVQMLIATLQLLGLTSFPPLAGSVFAASVCAALYCKRRSARAVAEQDCEGAILWHAMWHYSLPGGALLAQLLISTDESDEGSLKRGL